MPLATCPDCKKEVSTAALACPHCGNPILPRNTVPNNRAWYWVFITLLTIATMAGVAINLKTNSETVPQAATPATANDYSYITVDCACATNFDSAEDLLRSYRQNDDAAMHGLIVRGKAIQLPKYTMVYKKGETDGVVTIFVQSGAHSGEKCYVWRGFLH